MTDVLYKNIEMPRLRVLVAEDHEAMRDRVVCMLSKDFEVTGAVPDGESLVAAARALQPDLLVIDVSMPIMGGIEAANRLKELGSTARIIFLTIHEDPDCIRACLAAGALGYVVKSRLATELLPAINSAMAGWPYISPGLAARYPVS
jgi:DNA-binding NarL/FixJ family response regulator